MFQKLTRYTKLRELNFKNYGENNFFKNLSLKSYVRLKFEGEKQTGKMTIFPRQDFLNIKFKIK